MTHTHTYPRTSFLVTVSHYPLFQHIMDTLQLEYLALTMFSDGSRAFPHIGTVVLAMYYWCLLFVFLGLVVILQEHNSNCSFGILLGGIYYTRTPRFKNQAAVWRKKFCVGVKIACLPLFTTNLSSRVWWLTVRLSAIFKFPPAVPTHAYIRLHARIMLHLLSFSLIFNSLYLV